ncbi:MAG: SulP family inorganic anion transporter [Acidiferrobacterales bacterium]|nr:SulP family inorganic anion transporter [Acidiferrobacterales bacterium]
MAFDTLLPRNYSPAKLKGDIFGGLTASVVLLPLSLAFGIATGLGPSAGIYGAIAVGFFAAVFGGTPTQISGPTAPVAIAIAVIVASHAESIYQAFAIVSIAGFFQILLGLSGVGKYIEYAPRVVVSGFMSGIGVIIIVVQLLPLLGHAPVSEVVESLHMLTELIGVTNVDALIVGLVALGISIFWPARLGKYLPAPLVALTVATLSAVLWFPDSPVIGEIPSGLPQLQLFFPGLDLLWASVELAFILAMIASVESLISAVMADTMTGTRHKPSRELIGQGIGNIAAGLVGGLPGSGSPPGTAANIRAGASTAVSGLSYAIILVLIVLVISDVVEPIPLAALSGILIKVGWDVIDWRIVNRIHRIQRPRMVILLLTFGLTVFVDLLPAIALGLIAAAMSHARTIERFELDSVTSAAILDLQLFDEDASTSKLDPFSTRTVLVRLSGILSIASKTKLVNSVTEDIKDHEIIIFDFTKTQFVDDDIALVIEKLTEVATQDNIQIVMCGFADSVFRTMTSLNVLKLVPDENIVDDLEGAHQLARQMLRSSMN